MKKTSIKILDCTLRDGGYIIDWNFGLEKISSIITNLEESQIDFIECGFLKESNYDINKSFFSSISQLEKIISKNQNYTLMVNFGEYDIKNFSNCKSNNIKIRVAFKKDKQKEALKYIKELMDLGWDVFVNPMSTNTYTKFELIELIKELNKIKPYCLTIVDTLGNMYENDVIKIFKFINTFLDQQIAIGFHSHNSLQLSFSNTKAILKLNMNRTLIIDSCLYGMGRGAGNLCTELIVKYINDIYESKYKIIPILSGIEKNIKPIFEYLPWGYSTSYYVAAINGCHPNYATYLLKNKFSDKKINEILSKIPNDEKTSFDKNLIEEIANKFFTCI